MITFDKENKVEVKNITKKFGDLLVLDDISFNVKKGEFLSVVGPTGCGKTTFLNMLSKLYPTSAGDIYIDGEVADPKKHNIAYVFQEPSSMPWMTVQENIEFPLRLKGIPEDEIKRRVEEVLTLVGIGDARNKYPRELSVSTIQRSIIARAFAMKPDILLMDEPYCQLDMKLRYYLEDEVIRLWKELGSTVIFVTHNIEEAVYLAQNILVLSPKPATVKKILPIPLEHPRNVSSKDFVDLRNQVTDLIKWW